ncbi:MAG TPA: hypothetical protein VKT70_15700, partial [Stellaceae bacterium]|nr:hypothetical protein [Stellaceae bacterium]
RGSLDEEGWRRLRAECPPERTASDFDLRLARRYLSDPVLYSRALTLPLGSTRGIAAVGEP